jgi:hypothetical protein
MKFPRKWDSSQFCTEYEQQQQTADETFLNNVGAIGN